MLLEIGRLVDVGGCVGTISKITDTKVTVDGVYFYYGNPSMAEPWSFLYAKADLEQLEKRISYDSAERPIYDASDIKPVRS